MYQAGIVLAVFCYALTPNFTTHSWRRGMIENQDRTQKEKKSMSLSLETIIALGLFGWIALSMALMGLGIW
jgi:hypothetical protein